MASENSSSGARRAVAGNGETQLGPDSVPVNSVFDGANAHPGDTFGDKSSRSVPSAGSNLAMGLSECYGFHDEHPDTLGEGRDDATGKPDGPQRGAVNNGGAGAKLQWG